MTFSFQFSRTPFPRKPPATDKKPVSPNLRCHADVWVPAGATLDSSSRRGRFVFVHAHVVVNRGGAEVYWRGAINWRREGWLLFDGTPHTFLLGHARDMAVVASGRLGSSSRGC